MHTNTHTHTHHRSPYTVGVRCTFISYSVKEPVSVVLVQQYGFSVITSVVAHWLVTNRIQPKEFDTVQLSSNAAVKCKYTS